MDKKAIPLHPAQHDVYTEQLIDRNSPLYNVGGYIRLKGHLEPTALTNIIGNGPAVFDAFTLRFDMDCADHLAYINEATKTLEVELINFSNHLDAGEKALRRTNALT